MAEILVLNGPNLNLLGKREPQIYGSTSLEQLLAELRHAAQSLGHNIHHLQSNAEHVLIERIQQTMDENIDYIILNPAAYTHTSIALRDALLAVNTPFVEVHLTNISAREDFRRYSYFSDIAQGVIAGFGTHGYFLALNAINQFIKG